MGDQLKAGIALGGALTTPDATGTSSGVNRFTAYFGSFAFWGYFTRKITGGCRET